METTQNNEKQPTTALGPRNARCARVAQRDNDAKNIENTENHETQHTTALGAPNSAQEAPRPSQNYPETFPRRSQQPPKPIPDASKI